MSNNWDPYCVLCKHFEVEKFNQKHLRHCKAFQGKIPDDIIEGRVDHRLLMKEIMVFNLNCKRIHLSSIGRLEVFQLNM